MTPSMQEITEAVAKHYGLTPEGLRGTKSPRGRTYSVPRHVAFYLCRDLTECSAPQIGSWFGRDHTTVLHGAKKVREDMVTDSALAVTVENLRSVLDAHTSAASGTCRVHLHEMLAELQSLSNPA